MWCNCYRCRKRPSPRVLCSLRRENGILDPGCLSTNRKTPPPLCKCKKLIIMYGKIIMYNVWKKYRKVKAFGKKSSNEDEIVETSDALWRACHWIGSSKKKSHILAALLPKPTSKVASITFSKYDGWTEERTEGRTGTRADTSSFNLFPCQHTGASDLPDGLVRGATELNLMLQRAQNPLELLVRGVVDRVDFGAVWGHDFRSRRHRATIVGNLG